VRANGGKGARQRPSVSASGVGGVCLGGTKDANVFRAHVSAFRKPSGAEESGYGGPYNLADRLPSAARWDLLDESRYDRQDARQEEREKKRAWWLWALGLPRDLVASNLGGESLFTAG
jgi:hypothetical protein